MASVGCAMAAERPQRRSAASRRAQRERAQTRVVGTLLRLAVAPAHRGFAVNAELAAFACHHRAQQARATPAPVEAGTIMQKLDQAFVALNECVR